VFLMVGFLCVLLCCVGYHADACFVSHSNVAVPISLIA